MVGAITYLGYWAIILYRFRSKGCSFISFIKFVIGGIIMAYVALYIGYWVMIANL